MCADIVFVGMVLVPFSSITHCLSYEGYGAYHDSSKDFCCGAKEHRNAARRCGAVSRPARVCSYCTRVSLKSARRVVLPAAAPALFAPDMQADSIRYS